MDKKGRGITIFRQNFFVSQYRKIKNFVGEPFLLLKNEAVIAFFRRIKLKKIR